MRSVEIGQIDRRFEGLRLKDDRREGFLLSSIVEQGIQEPLRGVEMSDTAILLDGFKRLRGGLKAGLKIFPFVALATDEAAGILELLRIANNKSLNILEQARLVDELRSVHGLSIREIAKRLERSSGWVSMRAGLCAEMSEKTTEAIFSGRFPAYSYLYTLRQFIRMKQVKREEVEEFVGLVAGRNLSTRAIESLARGFFQGGDLIREQMRKGNLEWSLKELSAVRSNTEQNHGPKLCEIEAKFIHDLEILQKYMGRVSRTATDPRLTSAVYPEGGLLAGGILRLLPGLSQIIWSFHDRSGKT